MPVPERTARLLIAFGLTSSCLAQTASAPATRPATRKAFAASLARVEAHTPGGERGVKEGMPAAEIIKLLGEPDDVRTELDPLPSSNVGLGDVWCYGTNGHMTFPTLGVVYIENGRSNQIFGAGQNVINERLVSEEKLSTLLRLIDRVSSGEAWSFDPLHFLRAANALQPLGKEKVLAVVSEYLRVVSPWCSEQGYEPEGVALLLRALFDPAPGQSMPDMAFVDDEDLKVFPRFPLILIDDVPLVVPLYGGRSGGLYDFNEHVAFFRKSGRLRDAPLTPGTHPLKTLETLRSRPDWPYGEGNGDNDKCTPMQEQLLKLVDTVYRMEPDESGQRIQGWDEKDREPRWKDIVTMLDHLPIKWDSSKQLYTFIDGSHLDELPVIHYRRHIWRPDVAGLKIAVVFERETKRSVSIWIQHHAGDAHVRVFNTCCGSEDPIAELSTDSKQRARTIEIGEGCGIRAELTSGGAVIESPEYSL